MLGRIPPDTKIMTWSGTGVAFTFEGSSAEIVVSNITDLSRVAVQVDDGSPKLAYVKSPPDNGTLAISTPKLSKGKHRVVMRKVTEAAAGTFHFDTIKTDGHILEQAANPVESQRRIEFIGDSITAAYGILSDKNCKNISHQEDIEDGYAVKTSKDLKAEYSVIAVSGYGLFRNDGDPESDKAPKMPGLWTRYSALDTVNWTYTFPPQEEPQAVVIALGTNDFHRDYYKDGKVVGLRPALNVSEFKAVYIEFIDLIRSKYPGVEIFICSSPMEGKGAEDKDDRDHASLLHALQDIAKGPRSSYVTVVNFPSEDFHAKDIGCLEHPGISESKKMADILTPMVRKKLSW